MTPVFTEWAHGHIIVKLHQHVMLQITLGRQRFRKKIPNREEGCHFYPYDLGPCQVRAKGNKLSEVETLQFVTWESDREALLVFWQCSKTCTNC